MSTEIANNDQAMRDFQAGIIERLRQEISNSLPESVLQNLIKEAVQKQFFEEKVTGRDYNGRPNQWGPSWFTEEVAKQATPLIEAAVTKFIEADSVKISIAIEAFLQQQNLLLIAIELMRKNTYADLQEIANTVVSRMRQNY